MQLSICGNRVHVSAPYRSGFPAKARALGGRWDAERRIWIFNGRREFAVERLMVETYGVSGRKRYPRGPLTEEGRRRREAGLTYVDVLTESRKQHRAAQAAVNVAELEARRAELQSELAEIDAVLARTTRRLRAV